MEVDVIVEAGKVVLDVSVIVDSFVVTLVGQVTNTRDRI